MGFIQGLPKSSSAGFFIFGVMLILFHNNFGAGVYRKIAPKISGLTEKTMQQFYFIAGLLLVSIGFLILLCRR